MVCQLTFCIIVFAWIKFDFNFVFVFSVHISDCLFSGDEESEKDETVLEVLAREDPILAKTLKEDPLSWVSEVMYLGESDDYDTAYTNLSTLAIGNVSALPR